MIFFSFFSLSMKISIHFFYLFSSFPIHSLAYIKNCCPNFVYGIQCFVCFLFIRVRVYMVVNINQQSRHKNASVIYVSQIQCSMTVSNDAMIDTYIYLPLPTEHYEYARHFTPSNRLVKIKWLHFYYDSNECIWNVCIRSISSRIQWNNI